MQNRARAIFLVTCSLAMAMVVYAEIKKGYYAPEELSGILRQAAGDRGVTRIRTSKVHRTRRRPWILSPVMATRTSRSTATPATARAISPCSRRSPPPHGKPR